MRWPAPGTRSAPAFRNNRHMQDFIDRVRFDANGLVPVIAQDRASGTVLMLAWANADALRHTVSTRQGTYFSRSRGELWIKGATSGATQHVREVRLDFVVDGASGHLDLDGLHQRIVGQVAGLVGLLDQAHPAQAVGDVGPAQLESAGVVVCVGGDGTVLRAARVTVPFGTPLLGVTIAPRSTVRVQCRRLNIELYFHIDEWEADRKSVV